MKKFTILLLSVIFVALVACSIQSISADHLEPGQGIFVDESDVELVTSKDTNYQIYLQTVLRNGDGQLLNVTENQVTGAYIPHKITDDIFDTLMGEKEIVTIDNIKYEKVQYTFSPTLEQRWIGMYPIFTEGLTFKFKVEADTIVKMNEKIKDRSNWKIHYCATFEGHGFTCLPIFQDLVPNMTLEQDDIITHQWTILRILN